MFVTEANADINSYRHIPLYNHPESQKNITNHDSTSSRFSPKKRRSADTNRE